MFAQELLIYRLDVAQDGLGKYRLSEVGSFSQIEGA
jgi:hypothetical protein